MTDIDLTRYLSLLNAAALLRSPDATHAQRARAREAIRDAVAAIVIS